MQSTSKSSVKTSDQNPTSVFYVWYSELCRRCNSNPTALLRPAKSRCNTVLDFAADRLKLDEWTPFLSALKQDTSLHVIIIKSKKASQQFLHDIDTEKKARSVWRKYGSLSTDFTLNSLVRSLSHSLKNTQCLTSLELDGLPMFEKYLEILMKGLKENKSVKYLSLNNCLIQDSGCRIVCSTIQLLPNIEVLNLSNCDLSSVSGTYVAKVIKSHQLNRYTSSWHSSLRCQEPDPDKMCGLRRITMNLNPRFGDEGLHPILNELEDDLWVKALDMQKCGITYNIAHKILDILAYNKSLEIYDFRKNRHLDNWVIQAIFEILRRKLIYDDQPRKFRWCDSVDSTCPTAIPTTSRENMNTTIDEPTSSKPLATNETINQVKKTKTAVDLIKKNIENCATNRKPVDIAERKLLDLSCRRVQSRNKKKISSNFNVARRPHRSCDTNEELILSNTSNSVSKTLGKWNNPDHKATETAKKKTTNDTSIKQKFWMCSDGVKVEPNVLETGCKIRNSPNISRPNSEGDISAIYVKAQNESSSISSDDEASLLSYVNKNIDIDENHKDYGKKLEKLELSRSQLSLFEYMEELEQDDAKSASDMRKVKSQHHYKVKTNVIRRH